MVTRYHAFVVLFLLMALSTSATSRSIIEERCENASETHDVEKEEVCWVPFSVLLARAEDLRRKKILIQGYVKSIGGSLVVFFDKDVYQRSSLFESVAVSRKSDIKLYKKLGELAPGYVWLVVEVLPFDKPKIEAWTVVRLLSEPSCAPLLSQLELDRPLRETGPCEER